MLDRSKTIAPSYIELWRGSENVESANSTRGRYSAVPSSKSNHMKYLKLLTSGGACALISMIHFATSKDEVISYVLIAWCFMVVFLFIVLHDKNKKENERINKL